MVTQAASTRSARHQKIARRAGLNYVRDEQAGLSRRRCGTGFAILNGDGSKVSNACRDRVDALAIPPAWQDVWICPNERGHLQATGHDQRGRKQYRYHPEWAKAVHAEKFADLADFGESLVELRRQMDSDLRRRSLEVARTSALAVTLIDWTGARVGTREYARDNDSRGLTTLEKRHAAVHSTYARLRYTGKSHQPRDLRIASRRIARHLAAMKETPGKALLRYRGQAGWVDLQSDRVNEYLHEYSAGSPSAKRFRTWQGSLIAFLVMKAELGNDKTTKKAGHAAVRASAESLGNTIAVCRSHYIHPAVLTMGTAGAKLSAAPSADLSRQAYLDAEPQLIEFLRAN